MRAGKAFLLAAVYIAFLQTGVSQGIEIWTDHNSVNAAGDTIEIDYPSINKHEITDLRINESNKTIRKFNDSREEIFLKYNRSLNGDENLSIGYKLNSSTWKVKNIEENLTRFKTKFKGFYKDSDRLTRQIYYRELDNVKVKINVTKTNGKSISGVKGLLGEDFQVYSEGSQGEFKLDGSSSNPYILKFSGLPKMEPGKARFNLEMRYGPEINEFKVQKRVPFQGQVLGQSGSAKDATFEIIGSSINKFKTDDRGKFEELLEKRSVDKKIKLYLGDVTTTFGGLELQSDREENIRYEYYKGFSPNEVKTEKLLDPLNIVGFSSNYPIEIDETKVTMKYNSSGINPENVDFYECSYWDFLGKECRNEWEKLEDDELDHNEIRNEATLEDLETKGDGDYGLKSAYMAAVKYERPFLELKETLLDKKQFNVEDSIALEGKIRDGKNNQWVKDVDIEVTLVNNQNESVAKYRGVNTSSDTTENGLFSFDPVEIPDHEGEYKLEFKASKAGFSNISFTKEIQVRKTLNMSVKASTKEVTPGETSTAVFELANTGQTDIKNISVNETNLNPVYITITPERINELDAGETKSITVSSILPSNYCKEKDCSNGLNIEIKGVSEKGQNISSNSKVSIQYNKNSNPTHTGNQSENKEQNSETKNNENVTQGSEEKNNSEKNESSEPSNETGKDQIGIPLTDNEIKESVKEISTRIGDRDTETKLVFVALLLFALATLKRRNDGESRDLKINPKIDLKIGGKETTERNNQNIRTSKVRKPELNAANNREKGETLASDYSDNKSVNRKVNKKGDICPECGERFDTPEALGIHLKTQH